ncbi:MAG: ABC transporter substrate-binding protein [Lachnospiraceae bacterium]|nr:ABC transporter substrate-binding protein [Lachnospiraceae bacterium]
MKKRLLSLMTAAVMVVVLAGCSNASDGASKVYNIGVCQLVEHPALDAATQGFKEALTAKLGEDKVKFDVQNAQGEQATSATICNGFVSDNVDLILANATTPLQTAAAATSSIPILGTSVTDYASALQISNWNGTTGRNISGTSDLAPIDQQEKMLKELFPDVKKVGLLFCTAESNSAYQIDLFVKALEADGIPYVKYGVADSNEIQSVVTNAISECDVLYIPTDNTLANATETIYNIVVPAKVPVIVGEEGICKGCGVATLSISYYDLGYTTGEMAYEVLVNGKDIKTLEVKYAPNTTKKYNKSICEKLGISVPSDYTAIEE